MRPVFSNISWPQGWTLSPRGIVHPSLTPPPGWTLSLIFRSTNEVRSTKYEVRCSWWRARRPGLHPRKITSPLGANFTPWGQLHAWGQFQSWGSKMASDQKLDE
jgi:hypothetical protein